MADKLGIRAWNEFPYPHAAIPSGAPSKGPRGGRKLRNLEISYSSLLLFFWVLLLSYVAWGSGYALQAFTLLLLSLIALTSEHGESRLMMPLVFLSECCLEHQMGVEASFLHFYASALLSYLSLAACRGLYRPRALPRRHAAWAIPLVVLAGLAGFAWDRVFFLGVVAYAAAGHAFFLRLRPSLGENEAVLVSSLVGFYVSDACVNNNLSADGGRSLVPLNAPGYLTSYPHVAGRGVILFALYTTAGFSLLARAWRAPASARSKSAERRVSPGRMTALFALTAALVGGAVFAAVSYQFQENAAWWLYAYLRASPFRAAALAAWSVGIPAALVAIARLTPGLRTAARRKLFHLIAVAAFTPAALVDPPFLGLALSAALSLLVVAEIARGHGVYGAPALTRYLADYVDARDDLGGVVRTHLYLLAGLAVPLGLHYRHQPRARTRPLPAIAELAVDVMPGLLALGVVDASAAVIGSSLFRGSRRVLGRYLKNRFFTERANVSIAHKTTTGTLGGLLCGALFWAAILALEAMPLAGAVWYTFLLIAVCSLTECFINTVDNLQMPLVVLGVVYNLFAILLPVRELWENPAVGHSNPTRASSVAAALSFPWTNGARG